MSRRIWPTRPSGRCTSVTEPVSPAANLFHQSEAARQRGDRAASLRLIRACLKVDPSMPGPWYNLASDLATKGDRDGAVAALRRVLEVHPNEPYSLTNLGWNLQILGRPEEALEPLVTATYAAPHLPLGWSNLSLTHSSLRHAGEAITCARKAVELAPEDPQHHMALAFALMLDGQWAEGLREYEARFPYKMPEFLNYPMPRWDGKPVGTLLIMAEQGFGDTIQFCRYVRLAARRCQKVIVCLQEQLANLRLFDVGRNAGVEVITMPAPIPEADAFCPMVSLPSALGLSDAEVPAVGYGMPVWTPPLPGQLPGSGGRKSIGIVWAGSPDQDNDHHRSATIEDFLGLTESTSAVQLYSLQVGDRAAECRPYDPLVIDLAPRIRDFTDTAALMVQMDAVVSVCTAGAHLAGALGVSTHIVLPRHGQHFVWGYPSGAAGGDTTPWYPSARLYRQERVGDWRSVIKQVAEAL